MDKRRSSGYSSGEGSSRSSRGGGKQPRRINSSEKFLDASRDPRLSNDKYRAHMMSSGKARVSPDTTMSSKKSTKSESNMATKCQLCPNFSTTETAKLGQHLYDQHRNACFACGLCPNQPGAVFESIAKVRGHVEVEHSIDAKEIVDKLIKLPAVRYLKSYKCVACPASSSASSLGTSEDELKMHFKSKHKISTVKPFLIKRICRICAKDNFNANDDLDKHVDAEHPRSLFWTEDDEDEDDDNEDVVTDAQAEEEQPVAKSDDYLSKDDEEELNYEPKSPSPPPPPVPPPRDHEASSVPEDGELSADDSSKRPSRKRSRSRSSSSRSSRDSRTTKRRPRQYRDSSSSSDGSQRRKRPMKKRSRSITPPLPPLPSDTKRKVYLKSNYDGEGSSSRTSSRKDDSFFGVTYMPPAGYCEECDQRYESGERAQEHFQSKRHFFSVKNKYRCYFCNAYVQDTKGHLESRHRDMTFQCLLNGCNRPRFTQAAKVIDHVRCNHSQDYKRSRNDIDLFRRKMIAMPKNIMSFTCRECKVSFHGDIKIAIVHLVLEHGQNVPQRHHFNLTCRICGPRVDFINEIDLEKHCQDHLEEAFGGNRSRSRSRSSERSSQSRTRSPSPTRDPVNFRQGKNTLTCHFCPDQFRTLSIRKNHMLRDHQSLLFQCALCTFHNMYRRDLVWHLKQHHRKNDLSDQRLIKEYVHWPKDLRKIICTKCSETEAHENAVWMAVDPNEITKELKAHADHRHGVTGKAIDDLYTLQCIGCSEKFELGREIKDWDDHMDRQPCRSRRSVSRSRSRSRSRSPNVSNHQTANPVHIDLEKQCLFCCKQMESKAMMDDHVHQRHMDAAFICRLCDTGKHHYEPDLPAIKDHLKEDHGKDDLDNEDVKDFTRYPKSLICIKCNMCGLLCHAQKEQDLELHFKIFHEDCRFSNQHLDYLCRICMISGQNDSLDELRDHLDEKHPDDIKE